MLLSLKPVSLVDHEHARQARVGIFELLKVPGMASDLALITSLHARLLSMGPTLQTVRPSTGTVTCQHGLLLFDCGLP